MKKIIALALYCFLLMATAATAVETKRVVTCHYPAVCKKIMHTDYTENVGEGLSTLYTGSSEMTVWLIQMDCLNRDGQYVKYITRVRSLTSWVEKNKHLVQLDKIIFVPWDKDDLVCNIE